MGKICILLPAHWGAAKGGAEYQAHCFAEYITENTSHQVVYLSRFVPRNRSEYSYEIHGFHGPRTFSSLKWGYTPDAVSLYKKLVDIDPDVIVHMVAGAYTGVAAWYAKRRNRELFWYLASDMDVATTPNVGIDGPAKWLDRLVFKYGARHATWIIAQTTKQTELLKSTYDRKPAAVVSNFHPEVSTQIEKNSGFRVLWIANLKRLKQPEHFVRLAQELLEKADIQFRVIGRREESAWCNNVINSIDMLPNIEYLGELEIEAVNLELDQAHLLVNTSLYEGFPNTFIQGWMRAVPTISLNVDPDSVLKSQRIGILANDFETMKNCIVRLHENREALVDMGDRAQKYARDNCSMKNAQKLLQCIEDKLISKVKVKRG